MACSTQKEERRIITNSEVNYSLIRMDCPLASLSPHSPYLLFSLSHFLSWNDTGEESNGLRFLFMWFQEGIWRYLFSPLAERLTASGEFWYPHPAALFHRIVCTW